ncbi:MlaE family lipid ABC transporter permease subunit [Halomonas sp. HMF6819]|uniref:MlaE family lipid ABC transporter permease subunit n=1 Tax=Halomonas sp. HMF6819 TaxID=3373085 RepID=UPI00379B5D2A
MPTQWFKREGNTLTLQGEWTLEHYATLKKALDGLDPKANAEIKLLGFERIDTAGAALLINLLGVERAGQVDEWASDLPKSQRALIMRIASAMDVSLTHDTDTPNRLVSMLVGIGAQVEGLYRQQRELLGFIGLVLATALPIMINPRRWRVTATVAHVQQSGLNAVPIVMLLTFMVGAVVAFLGATVLQSFGATVYTINLVAFSFLREFGVLLAAILLAGRTASAFTAQLGAMKSNEEIDALKALGLDPIELLVLPRILAMLVSLPLLAFIGMLSGLLGGAVVSAVSLDIPFYQFMNTLQESVSLNHFLVGLAKAPVFAFIIAVIGCLEGFKVAGSAQSVGAHTTSSVVQSIFMVILIDALAALFFMEMGW